MKIILIILGNNTNHLTVSKELFVKNPLINYWKFEVIYLFSTGISLSSIHFNKSPSLLNGNCSINPLNGTTKTLFYISCSNWFNENDIQDYSFYGLMFIFFSVKIFPFFLVWTNDYSKLLMIGFSLISRFHVRLPNVNSLINLNISIRNKYNSIKQFNIYSINVYEDPDQIETNNSFVNGLLTGNQNLIGQIIISITQKLEKMNNDYLNKILSS